MNDRQHDELKELLGAYALNATDPLERRRVERHLAECDECTNELRLLTEASAELAWLASPEDASDLVERISQRLPRKPRRMTVRIASGVAAVAVAAAGFLGYALVSERAENDSLAEVLASATRRVDLGPRTGFAGRGVLHIAEGRAALVLEDMPDAGRDRAYQLWAITGTKPRSVSVIAGGGRIVRLIDWSGRADTFAITIEPEGGSPVPTSDPVLTGSPS